MTPTERIYCTVVVILSILIGLVLTSGCAKVRSIKVVPPTYPILYQIQVSNNGTLDKTNTEKAAKNMVELQELIDLLYLAPCWEE